MDDSMYPTDETSADKSTSDQPDNSGQEDKMEGESFLVPKSAVAGYKVGDKCTFKVVHEYSDECELAPVSEKEETTPDDETMEGANSQLDKMATNTYS